MIYVRDENDYAVLRRAEEMLETSFNWNINDDDFKGWVNVDEYDIIDELCSKIDYLQERLEEQKESYEETIKEFYKPKSSYEIYGVNEGMFH